MSDRQPFLEALADRVILGDGGMGTEIYARGVFINRCYDELNLSNPKLVQEIHADFIKAGSELIESNTYGANRIKLKAHGLEDRLSDIVTTGVRLAREVAGEANYVAASIGALGPANKTAALSKEVQTAAYQEVAALAAEAGADVLFLETFHSVLDLVCAVEACRATCALPIVASFSFHRGFIMGNNDFLVQPEDVVEALTRVGADVVGANCGDGPHTTLDVIEKITAHTKTPVAACPNVGGPALIEGRQMFLSSPEYMAEYSRRFVQKHARLVGGCCGVTPAQIKEVRSYLMSIQPRRARIEIKSEGLPAERKQPLPIAERSPWGAKLGKDFLVSVELDPPHGLAAPTKSVEAARFLHDNGIDAVNIADGPRAMARMTPAAMAQLVRREVEIETIIHYCCRDRNVLAMQSDLIGANALGLHNLMLITGDPPKMGPFPEATAVFDVDAIGLVTFANMLNHGLDLSGTPAGEPTRFVLGVGCNPGAVDLDLEVARFGQKIEAGAEYVFSQPVYDPERLTRFLEATADFPRIPFFVGILPLASLKNAEFLTREVPGMEVPDAVMHRLRDASTREDQREVGIRVASESLAAAVDHERVRGAYIFPPFGRYEPILRVLKESGARS